MKVGRNRFLCNPCTDLEGSRRKTRKTPNARLKQEPEPTTTRLTTTRKDTDVRPADRPVDWPKPST
ncbi:hypothetical protein BaRGS_00015101, partial [Batillaria attramentaria]